MDDFGPQLAAELFAACQANADAASEAFGASLAVAIDVAVQEHGTLSDSTQPPELSKPGLAMVFSIGEQAAVLMVADILEVLPRWCRSPTAEESEKLSALAEQLGKHFFPPQYAPTMLGAGFVADLRAMLDRCGCAEGAGFVRFKLTDMTDRGEAAFLVWPLDNPSAAFVAPPPPPSPAPQPSPSPSSPPPSREPEAKSAAAPVRAAASSGINSLPLYSRSLLRIQVPVIVTLAKKRQSVGTIVELVPGSIIQFSKSCEEALDLEVGSQKIAQGECVKVGEKFGLRVSALVLPDERFRPLSAADLSAR